MSRRRHLRYEHGRLLEPREGQQHRVQRRQRLHPIRHLSGRRLHRREPRHVLGARSMPRHGHLRYQHRHLLEPDEGQQHRVQRRQRLHPIRHLVQAGVATGANTNIVTCSASSTSATFRRHLRYEHRHLLEPRARRTTPRAATAAPAPNPDHVSGGRPHGRHALVACGALLDQVRHVAEHLRSSTSGYACSNPAQKADRGPPATTATGAPRRTPASPSVCHGRRSRSRAR